MSAEAYFLIVDGKVSEAAPELKQQLARVTVAFVLLNGIFNGLLRQAVLQLEGGDGQSVDKDAQVERELGFVFAVAKLARDAETVSGKLLLGFGISERSRKKE